MSLRKSIQFSIILLLLSSLHGWEQQAQSNGESAGNPNNAATQSQPSKQELLTTFNRIHEELNRLEVQGQHEKMLDYMTDDIVRIGAGRPITRKKQAWLDVAKQMRQRGIRVGKITTKILDIWQSEDKVYEYGSMTSSVRFAGASQAAADAISYFNIWRRSGDSYKAEFFMWTPVAPLKQINQLASQQ